MFSRAFTYLVLVVVSFLVVACGGDQETKTPMAPMLALTTVAALTATPNRSTPPSPTPVRPLLNPGETLRVWMYANAPTALGDCANRLSFMVPLQAPADFAGQAVECRWGGRDQGRYRYALDADGVAHLEDVQLLLLGNKDLPQPVPPLANCRDLLPGILHSTDQPSEAKWRFVCTYQMPVRNEQRPQVTEVWGILGGESTTTEPVPSNRRCWELLAYLGGPETVGIPVRCLLD